MQISFKGFQNTGIGVDINRYPRKILKNNNGYIRPPYVHLSLTTTLNNNGDKDKEFFAEILEKFPNRYHPDTINFHYDRYYSDISQKYKKEFWLNDKPLILRDENLGIFSKLAQLFTKISNSKDLNVPDSYYINSTECRGNFNYFLMQGKNDLLQSFHFPSIVRKNAKMMTEEFNKVIFEYLEN